MVIAPNSKEIFQPTMVDPRTGYEISLPPTNLPFDDGEPLGTNRHRIAMNVLIRSLKQAWSDRNDFFAGGNMFIYFSSTQARNQTDGSPAL
jgi:Uma2 family endonuclease